MAVTINPSHTVPSRETNSIEPRAARQHAAAAVTIKLRYKKDPPDTLISLISKLSFSPPSSGTHSKHFILIGQS
ncbi:hypothetical protein COCNU_14G004420 [Cocos nucifera]|uniref:Uncharacterized protein n=1 Tax=Cocos nucifera TaxID=13894 RepID=A0A8K0NBZ1_COCNU|nr:hypothetical protein COCNU_14G004420 [Cocos nucifera]